MLDTPQAQHQALQLTHEEDNQLQVFNDGVRSILSQRQSVTRPVTTLANFSKTSTHAIELELERAMRKAQYHTVAALAFVLQSRN